MSRLPIVPQFEVRTDPSRVARAEAVAEQLEREDPVLRPREAVRDLVVDTLGDAPTLHIDDLGEIPLVERFHSAVFLEDRARMRAGEGDFLATCAAPNPRFESYTEYQLGLGSVTWLHPLPAAGPLRVATACVTDRGVRRTLVRALRAGRLRYLHPNMGTAAVWAVARILKNSSRRPFSVIAPPPGLTRRVNDKLWFARTVALLFGDQLVPRTVRVSNFTALAAAVWHLLHDGSRAIVVKIPDSAGGSGNHVLDPASVRGASIAAVRRRLRERLTDLPWRPGSRLLVGTWEGDVLAAPSSQLWIPPERDGLPVLEGVYEQAIAGPTGAFQGSRPAQLPAALVDGFAEHSWLLARLFQRLGYVGRCSFDAILVGADLSACRLELIECNGRWGGTSAPMTLVNRLFGNWQRQPYAARKSVVEGLRRAEFDDLLEYFAADAFDARTRTGSLVFYSPGRLCAASGIDIVAFADDWDEAHRIVSKVAPERLHRFVAQHSNHPTSNHPTAGV